MSLRLEITIREIMDAGKWLEYCDYAGINEWAVNEGMMDSSDIVYIDLNKAMEIGLV